MDPLLFVGLWIAFLLLNVFLAWSNDALRRRAIHLNIKNAIKHGWWGFLYVGLCAVPLFWIRPFPFFYLSIVLHHASVFPVAFNLYAGESPFNLSKSTTAIFDQAQIRIGLKSAEIVNLTAMALSIGLLILQIRL